MSKFFQKTAPSLAKPVHAFLRNLIDGPNPSAPYSWAGTVTDTDMPERDTDHETDGYESMC